MACIRFLPALLPSILGVSALLLGGAVPASASSLLEKSTLEFAFVGSVKDLPVHEPAAGEVATEAFTEGQTYSAMKVLETLQKKNKKKGAESLLKDANLSVILQRSDGTVLVHEVIAQCAKLDLYVDRVGILPESARCDGAVYGVSIDRGRLALTKDGSPVQHYRLAKGSYLLNGVPITIGRD
jgi:hypothetical protein